MPVCIPDMSSVIKLARGRTSTAKVRVVSIAFTSSGHRIARAINKAIFGATDKFSIHSEDSLVRKLRKLKAKERYGKIFVVVVRWSRLRARWTMAKPCENCQKILKDYGIEDVYYSNREGDIIRLRRN